MKQSKVQNQFRSATFKLGCLLLFVVFASFACGGNYETRSECFSRCTTENLVCSIALAPSQPNQSSVSGAVFCSVLLIQCIEKCPSNTTTTRTTTRNSSSSSSSSSKSSSSNKSGSSSSNSSSNSSSSSD